MIENKQSSSFIRYIYVRLNMMLEQALNLEMIDKNPCRGVQLPKAEVVREITALTTEEQEILISHCRKDRRDDLFIFLLGAGMRISEALALTWNNIDFDTGIIDIK